MRICVDLDGVVARLRVNGESYSNVQPVEGAIEKLKALKSHGHYIILNTARHMKSCEANVGLVVARQGKATLDWLERHGVPYDEIYFGKPWADVYLDDNAQRFNSWDEISDNGESFLPSSETTLKKGSSS